MSDEPKGERAVTEARVGNLLHDMRSTLDDLIALRNKPVGAPLVANEEAELVAIRDNLNFLLSDILLSRRLAASPLRVVSHG